MSRSNGALYRASTPRRLRVPVAVAGAAVLGLSLLLSVSPAMGAANNGGGGAHGTSGNVKVQDAATGVESTGSDNEPHVCSFRLVFTLDAPFEAGTWVVERWAPTGTGTVASGTYNTGGDGIDSSGVIELAAGHYRVEWQSAGATSSKKKTFWVDACADAPPVVESQPEELPPTEAPSSPDEDSEVEELPVEELPVEESQAEDLPPSDAPSSPDEESPTQEPQPEELPPSDAPSSPDEESPTQESETEELVLSGEGTAPPDEESQAEEAPSSDVEDADVVEEPITQDDTSPQDAPAEDPASIAPEDPPAQDQLPGIGAGDEPTMPDTATPVVPVQSGAPAALGLLMVILIRAVVRRDRLSDRDIVG